MIDAETLDILNVMNQRISDMNKRIDDVFLNLHNQSTQNIDENSEGLFDIAALADENSEAIMELAEMIAEMEG